uniref:RNA helicase n=1 Tax=Oryza barthii TaxID=65489 RepID=A0A0D3FXU5_9ORYZ
MAAAPPPPPPPPPPPQLQSSDPSSPPQETSQVRKGKKSRGAKKPRRAAASMVEDPFLVLAGGKEGGFLELEEIDEADFGIFGGAVEDLGEVDRKAGKDQKKKKRKKRKRGDDDYALPGDGDLVVECEEEGEKGEKRVKKKRGSRKKRKVKEMEEKLESKEDVSDDNVEDMQDGNDMEQDNNDGLVLGEDEVYAWRELRLHPLLITAVRRLGFKEPTPIQKACFPAAAHQGKDVIGAAETGSGKTLAFGLPILQRLLEEQEKAMRLSREDESTQDENSRESPLRALILTPTRELAKQVCDHLKEAAKFLRIQVVPIVGGLSMEKQERLLKRKPEIVVGTPGRLWELMSTGNQHLIKLHSLSFFVLDEADRMIERGHFHELQSIIEMLPVTNGSDEQTVGTTPSCETVPILQIKKRQTFVFSATLALSANFRKKLKRGLVTAKASASTDLSSIEALSKQAGMKPNAEIVDLTKASILPEKLEESFIECSDDDKDAYLYYILSVHGQGRTIIFCTSIAALRHLSSTLRVLGINVLTNHAQMQQRARMKAVDRFRESENSILVATDGFARGMDFDDVRTVIHYQLPHSTDVYIHRSGRTARKSMAGCSIALISPADKAKFYSLCKSLSKENLQQFPVDHAYMPAENANKSWLQRNAESMGLLLETSDSEEERVQGHKQRKATSANLQKLQQDLSELLQRPLQPKTFSRRYLAGAGVSPLLQKQLEELSKRNVKGSASVNANKGSRFVVIGQDQIEPLQALQNSGQEVCVSIDKQREKRRLAENWRRKKQKEKKSTREQKRKEKRIAKERD